MSDENKSLDEMKSDNDFAEKFWKVLFNAIVMFVLLIILSLTLFKGEPDLVDNISSAVKSIGGNSCQN